MKIWHRFTFNHKDDVETTFLAWNIKFKKSPLPGNGYLLHVEVSETDDEYTKIAEVAKAKHALDIFSTSFTEEEILNAEWVRLCPGFEQGYPEPYDTGEWEEVTYSNVCPKCGAGLIQYAPFRIKKEPKLGSRHFVCLYATYELLCLLPIAQELRQLGVKSLDFVTPIILKSKEPSNVVTQWKVLETLPPSLENEVSFTVCMICGERKYVPHSRGYMTFRKDVLNGFDGKLDVIQTYEWFGSGHAAYRETLISNRLAQIFLQRKWKGMVLEPVKLI